MSNKVLDQRLIGGGVAVLFVGLVAFVLSASGTSRPAQAADGGGAGVATGTAQFAINVGNDGVGVPGGTVAVSVALTVAENVGSLNIDIVFDSDVLSVDADNDCMLSDTLPQHSLTASTTQGPLRLVVNDFALPVAEIGVGDVATCFFAVAGDAPIGETTELVAERVSAGTAGDGIVRICGPQQGDVPCLAENAVVRIQPAGDTPTPQPTATLTPPQPTATPTEGDTPTPTAEVDTPTPTVEVDTPTATIPQPTRTATEPVEATPTATRVPATNTPRPQQPQIDDDSCAIVPVSGVNPWRSLVLLIAPAILLWGRRRSR